MSPAGPTQQQDRSDRGRAGVLPRRSGRVASWALASHEREAVKEERAEEHRRDWMRRQPATPAQVSYLAALGHRGPVGSRQRASELIEEKRRGPGQAL